MAPSPHISFHRAISFEELLLSHSPENVTFTLERLIIYVLSFCTLARQPTVDMHRSLEQRGLLAPVSVQASQSYLNPCLLQRILYKPPECSSGLIQLKPNTTIPKSKTSQWDTLAEMCCSTLKAKMRSPLPAPPCGGAPSTLTWPVGRLQGRSHNEML